MKLTKRAAYGLSFLVLLAREPEQFRSARDLAEQEGLSETFVRQVPMRLRRAGFLETERGRRGGYKLAQPPERIRVAAVLRALEEDLVLALAGERTRAFYEPDKRCPTAGFWARMERKFWEDPAATGGKADWNKKKPHPNLKALRWPPARGPRKNPLGERPGSKKGLFRRP